MGSFNGQSFGEFGSGAGGPYPTYPTRTLIQEKERPSNLSILQDLGADVERFSLVVRVTKSELLALYDEWLQDGELVCGYGTFDAFLAGIPDAEERGAGKDVYVATLDLIKL